MKNLRAALEAGEVLIGPGCISGYASVVEIMGYVGFDWVFIDTEQAAQKAARPAPDRLVF